MCVCLDSCAGGMYVCPWVLVCVILILYVIVWVNWFGSVGDFECHCVSIYDFKCVRLRHPWVVSVRRGPCLCAHIHLHTQQHTYTHTNTYKHAHTPSQKIRLSIGVGEGIPDLGQGVCQTLNPKPCLFFPPFSPSLFLSLSLSLSLDLSLSRLLYLSLDLSLTLSLTRSFAYSISRSLSRLFYLSLALSRFISLSLSLSLSPPPFLHMIKSYERVTPRI